MSNKSVILQTDCFSRQVPSGLPLYLTKGTRVQVVQALGGSVTVNIDGELAQIAARDAHALGPDYAQPEVAPESRELSLEDRVWGCLRRCFDPEIPVNIVDLGLVYGVQISDLSEGGRRVDVRMTLTAPACGMGAVLAAQIEDDLKCLPEVTVACVEIVYDPPWSQDMMSEAAKLELGML